MSGAETRSAEYRERQKRYDEERRKSTARREQTRQARQKYEHGHKKKRRLSDKQRRGRHGDRRIVGVDGEGQDFFVCRRCRRRCSSAGGDCPRGGRHAITQGCSACGERGARAWETCPAADSSVHARGGPHILEPAADGHIYTYLAAVDEHGRLVAEAHNPEGLSHDECADMLLAIPRNTLKFGFMFSYDVTKICEEMPPPARYYLMRPKAREGAVCKDKECKADVPLGALSCHECGGEKIRKVTKPLLWRGRSYDFFNGSLTVSQMIDGREFSTKVWDCFKFFGCAFVEALRNWSGCKQKDCGGLMKRTPKGFACVKCAVELKDFGLETPVATDEQIARIDGMKQKRGAFDQEDPEDVKRYCREECLLLARMMRRLIDAHEKAGIPLRRYDGAGSTATALLRTYDVAKYKGPRHRELDPHLAYAIACAFFGGRFEDSVVGVVDRPVHGYDISSAYPFALTLLPCLECGFWRHEKRMTPDKLAAIQKKGGLALCRFHVRPAPWAERKELAWCPLPFRSPEGSISYGTNFSGWSWGQEVDAALRGWGDLVRLDGEAWVYEVRCKHQPFAFLPEIYRQRNKWGKEGAGIVLKLGMNASYGKTAQSLGDDPPFQSWIWAGVVTATTRGQLLDAIASARDRWNVLAVATDGVFALEELALKAPPRSVGTDDMKKPLGGWEYKSVPQGIFLAKPGLYYSLSKVKPELSLVEGGGQGDGKAVGELKAAKPVEEKGAFVRARGVGRREVASSRAALEAGFLRWDRRDPKFAVPLKSRRFYGAKHSIYARSSCVECETSWPGVPERRCEGCKPGRIGTRFETQLIETADGRPAYGTWDVRTVKIAFDPHPKRERTGLSRRGTFARLTVRDLGGGDSAPYDVGGRRTSPEGEAARAATDFAMEQPDWDKMDAAR